MKMNKKLAALMMSVVVVGSLFAGCGKNDQPAEEQPIVNETVEDTEEPAQQPEEELNEEVVEEESVGTEGEDLYEEEDPTPSQEMFYVVTEGIETPASMAMPEEMFQDTYGIDPSLLSSYYVAMPMMNVHADEVAIFELNSEADMAKVKEGIEKRRAALEAQWQSYLPEQLELVQNAQVVEKGNKVMFVISREADQIIANFNAAQ